MNFENRTYRVALRRAWARAFTVREIHLSSESGVRSVRLSPRIQQVVCFFLFCGLLTLGYSLYVYDRMNDTITGKERLIEDGRFEYFELLQLVGEFHTQFSRLTENLQRNQKDLLSLHDHGEDNFSPEDALKTLRKSEAEKHRVIVAKQEIEKRLGAFESHLEALPGLGGRELLQRVAGLRTVLKEGLGRDELLDGVELSLGQLVARQERQLIVLNRELRDQKKLEQQIEQLSVALDAEQEKLLSVRQRLARVQEEKTSAQSQLAQESFEKDDLAVTLTGYIDQTADLNRELDRLKASMREAATAQRDVLARFSQRSQESIRMIESTVKMSGLDANSLLGIEEESAQGGPFVSEEGDESEKQWHASIFELRTTLDRLDLLYDVVARLPLSAPMDHYRLTSSFGKRRDPFTGRIARHNGIDLVAPIRSSVYAPAPGKVVYAGWRGSYGRFIEIDHGNGIRTRYAHLNKILVQRGQMVEHRDKIGLLGNSGRSTGPHVHYEVLLNGRYIDPRKFVKAGKHVFKN